MLCLQIFCKIGNIAVLRASRRKLYVTCAYLTHSFNSLRDIQLKHQCQFSIENVTGPESQLLLSASNLSAHFFFDMQGLFFFQLNFPFLFLTYPCFFMVIYGVSTYQNQLNSYDIFFEYSMKIDVSGSKINTMWSKTICGTNLLSYKINNFF